MDVIFYETKTKNTEETMPRKSLKKIILNRASLWAHKNVYYSTFVSGNILIHAYAISADENAT